MNNTAEHGFNFLVEVEHPDGRVSQRETVHNLTPIEGRNHIASVIYKQGTQVPTWFIGLFEGNYTPQPDVKASTIAAAAAAWAAWAAARAARSGRAPAFRSEASHCWIARRIRSGRLRRSSSSTACRNWPR